MGNIGTKHPNPKHMTNVGLGAPQALPSVVLTPAIQVRYYNKTQYPYGQ